MKSPTSADSRFAHLSDESFVARAYAVALHRLPDPEGLAHYLSRLRAGESRTTVLESLRNDANAVAEAAPAPPPDVQAGQAGLSFVLSLEGSAFVRAAYTYVLGRPADPSGLQSYLEQLERGMAKLVVLESLRESAEARASGRELPDLDAALREASLKVRASLVVAATRRLIGRRLRA